MTIFNSFFTAEKKEAVTKLYTNPDPPTDEKPQQCLAIEDTCLEGRPIVAVCITFDEKQDPDPDGSEKLDPDPH